MDLFEWGDGRKERDDGMDLVLSHTPEYFRFRLYCAFWMLLESGEPFTAEDARPFTGDPPNHPNAYGAIWSGLVNRAFREGLLELVGHTLAERTTSHSCDMKIYRKIQPPGVEVEGM